METGTAVLRPEMHSKDTLEFENQLRAKIVGQDAGIKALVELNQIFCADLDAPNRPAGTLLFLGLTGTGKFPLGGGRGRSLNSRENIYGARQQLLKYLVVQESANFSKGCEVEVHDDSHPLR